MSNLVGKIIYARYYGANWTDFYVIVEEDDSSIQAKHLAKKRIPHDESGQWGIEMPDESNKSDKATKFKKLDDGDGEIYFSKGKVTAFIYTKPLEYDSAY